MFKKKTLWCGNPRECLFVLDFTETRMTDIMQQREILIFSVDIRNFKVFSFDHIFAGRVLLFGNFIKCLSTHRSSAVSSNIENTLFVYKWLQVSSYVSLQSWRIKVKPVKSFPSGTRSLKKSFKLRVQRVRKKMYVVIFRCVILTLLKILDSTISRSLTLL